MPRHWGELAVTEARTLPVLPNPSIKGPEHLGGVATSKRHGPPRSGATTCTLPRRWGRSTQGFGVGVNGPLTVVVKLPKQSSSDNTSLLSTMQSDISKTAGVASVTPAAVNSDGTTAVFNVIPTTRPQSTATTNLVITLRD